MLGIKNPVTACQRHIAAAIDGDALVVKNFVTALDPGICCKTQQDLIAVRGTGDGCFHRCRSRIRHRDRGKAVPVVVKTDGIAFHGADSKFQIPVARRARCIVTCRHICAGDFRQISRQCSAFRRTCQITTVKQDIAIVREMRTDFRKRIPVFCKKRTVNTFAAQREGPVVAMGDDVNGSVGDVAFAIQIGIDLVQCIAAGTELKYICMFGDRCNDIIRTQHGRVDDHKRTVFPVLLRQTLKQTVQRRIRLNTGCAGIGKEDIFSLRCAHRRLRSCGVVIVC